MLETTFLVALTVLAIGAILVALTVLAIGAILCRIFR